MQTEWDIFINLDLYTNFFFKLHPESFKLNENETTPVCQSDVSSLQISDKLLVYLNERKNNAKINDARL